MSSLVRRVVLAPAVVVLVGLLFVLLPLWLIAAAALSPLLRGRWRALRLLWIFVLYLTCESLMLVVLFGLWLASGFGWRIRTPYFEGIHYDLVQGVMWVFFREARRVLRLRIVTDGPAPDAHPGVPILVACRHAGPGDSFTLIHALMHWYNREPRVVLKDTLAWDPMIDVVLRRIRTPYFEGIHYDLVQGVTWVFFREAKRVLALTIETDGPTPDAHPGKPLLVCCRHAGPGDSFTLIHALMHWYDREPRVVLKDTLQWDPAIEVLLHRIPARFISPNPGAGEDLESQIRALATGLDRDDAFVIFPEGGNFTAQRRDRAIARLRKLGLERMAQRAEAMTNVLAPRPGGLLAALDAAPEADVVLVAHTGLDHLLTVGDIWRELPMDKQIVMRWWRVPRAEIPPDREGRIDWLFSRWEEIDDWIDANRTESA